MSKERAAKVMQEIFSKGTYEGDLLGINEGGKMSNTPRTDFVAHESGDPEWNRSINRFGRMQSHAQILERELAEAKEQLRLCNVDQFTTAAELSETIAKERERCARVSEKYPSDLHTRPEQWLAAEIAAAIRKGE